MTQATGGASTMLDVRRARKVGPTELHAHTYSIAHNHPTYTNTKHGSVQALTGARAPTNSHTHTHAHTYTHSAGRGRRSAACEPVTTPSGNFVHSHEQLQMQTHEHNDGAHASTHARTSSYTCPHCRSKKRRKPIKRSWI